MSGKKIESSDERKQRQDKQRNEHTGGGFAAGLRNRGPWLAEEHHNEQPRHVKRGQKGGKERSDEDWAAAVVSESEDCIFAEETGKWWTADECECARAKAYER